MLVSLAGSAVELTEAGYADNLYCTTTQEVSTAHEHCRAGQSIRPARFCLLLAIMPVVHPQPAMAPMALASVLGDG